MALNPLANSLSLLAAAPNVMNFRTDPTTLSPIWSATTQYFKGDSVISSVNGGMYIFGGGTGTEQTASFGGVDPSQRDPADSGWWPAQSTGLLFVDSTDAAAGSVTAVAGANGAMVIPATLSYGPFPPSNPAIPGLYLVNIQAQVTAGAAPAGGEGFVWTLTPNGAGAVAVNLTTTAAVGDVNWGCSASCVVRVPAAGTQIILSGTNTATAWPTAAPTLGNVKVTYSFLRDL